MAEEQPAVTSAVEDKPADTTESAVAGEAVTTSDAQESAPAAPATEESTTNGDKSDIPVEDVATAGPQATTQVNPPDGGEKTEADPVAASSDATQTAASSGKSRRRSSVPEHKQKKTIGKKKSMVNLNLDVQPGDHYWARLKGYPPWPAVICDESMLPEVLLASRPVSTMRPDGTYREDFQDGGKNVKDRTYPIMFLATNEFAWMINTSLAKLNPAECVVDENNKKLSKDLKAAYKIAEEEHDLDYYKKMLSEHEKEMQNIAEEQARYEAEIVAKEQEKADKAAKKLEDKPKSKSRKSKGAEDSEMDLDGSESKSSSKKRKKEAESEGEGKPKKTPKVKLAASKDQGTPSAKKSKKAAPSDSTEPQTEAQKFEARKLRVLHLRHRLQKGFISREGLPKDEEMPTMNDYFNMVETSQDIDAAIIRETKVHKVLKAIIKMETIPRDEEFSFRERSQTLLQKWTALLEGTETTVPATNGEVESIKKDIEQEQDPSTEPPAAPVETTDPGNAALDEADVKMDDATPGAEAGEKGDEVVAASMDVEVTPAEAESKPETSEA